MRFQTWAKHWFVLRGASLTLYRDTAAEDSSVTDGVIDLSRAQSVEERDTERNYGFQITVRRTLNEVALKAVRTRSGDQKLGVLGLKFLEAFFLYRYKKKWWSTSNRS